MAQKDKASYCQEPHRQCLQRQTHDSIITLVSDVHYYQAARAAVHSCYTSNSALRKREEVCLLFDIVARQNRSCSAHKTRTPPIILPIWAQLTTCAQNTLVTRLRSKDLAIESWQSFANSCDIFDKIVLTPVSLDNEPNSCLQFVRWTVPPKGNTVGNASADAWPGRPA